MTELPSGTVTFLFSDIESSTRLLKQLRDRYGAVVADHQRLLRAAFAEHLGREVDTQGDAFFVAFPTARDAVLAAASAQRALAGHSWPTNGDVKVRIGIHTGGAALAAEKYTGLGVHRAARICAAGHGGQVLVSQTTQNLLEDEEEELEGLRLRDLGSHRLKDLDRRIRLYQLVGPGLVADFPPPRTAEAPRQRKRLAILGASTVAAVIAAALAVLLTRGSGSGVTVAANSVGVIDPQTSKVIAQIPVGVRPDAIAVGGNAVWVANTGERTVTRIDTRTRMRGASVALTGKTPTGLAVGLGRVWVAHGLLGAVSYFDPAFGNPQTISRVAAVATGDSRDAKVTVGGGSVWAAFGDSEVVRIAPSANPQVTARSFAGNRPSGIVFDRGSLWVANKQDNTLSHFSPTTFDRGPLEAIHVGRGPAALAAGGGSLWVADSVDGRVTELDESTRATNTIQVGRDPEGIAYGEGAVWVANAKDGTVSRIDASTGRVVKTIGVGNSPVSVSTGAGLVWVTVQAPI